MMQSPGISEETGIFGSLDVHRDMAIYSHWDAVAYAEVRPWRNCLPSQGGDLKRWSGASEKDLPQLVLSNLRDSRIVRIPKILL